jgi:hypothetical protein
MLLGAQPGGSEAAASAMARCAVPIAGSRPCSAYASASLGPYSSGGESVLAAPAASASPAASARSSSRTERCSDALRASREDIMSRQCAESSGRLRPDSTPSSAR